MATTPIPTNDNRSTAVLLLEEYDQLQRDLKIANTETAHQKAMLGEALNKVDLLENDRNFWRTRANTYFAYAIELGVTLQSTIEQGDAYLKAIAHARQIAEQVTREKLVAAANEEAVASGEQAIADVLKSSERSTMPPSNQLPS